MKSGYALLLAAMLALPMPAHAAGPAEDTAVWSEPLDPIIVTATYSASQHGEAVAPGVQNIIDTEPLPMNLRHARPVIAVVIDDMGLDRTRNPKVIKLPKEVTLSYLPYSPNIRWQASEAMNGGHELLLHMPMEPERKTANPGPDYLGANMNPLELQSRLVKNLSAFGGYVGINNHMGSKLTCSRDALSVVMAELKERKLSFLDSRTGDCATAETVAREYGLKTTHRDIFLDHNENASAVAAALADTEAAARRTGSAIAIGHPKDNTINALAKWLPTLEAKGFQLVPVSQVIDLRNWRKPSTSVATAAVAPKKTAPTLLAGPIPVPVPAITPPAPTPARAVVEEETRDNASLPVTPVLAYMTSAEMAEKVPATIVAAPAPAPLPRVSEAMPEPVQVADIPAPVPATEPETAVVEKEVSESDDPPGFVSSARIAGLSYKTEAVVSEPAAVRAVETPVTAAEEPVLVPSPRIAGLSYKTDATPVETAAVKAMPSATAATQEPAAPAVKLSKPLWIAMDKPVNN